MGIQTNRIIGLGNPLMGDDGLGVKAIELLQQEQLPTEVELIDGGCGGLKLLPLFSNCQKLLIIDAADFGAPPGQLRILTYQEFKQLPVVSSGMAGHLISLPELLSTAQTLSTLPSLTLFLMQVASCHPAVLLSAPVKKSLPSLITAIRENISRDWLANRRE